jgi:hypothetical protein
MSKTSVRASSFVRRKDEEHKRKERSEGLTSCMTSLGVYILNQLTNHLQKEVFIYSVIKNYTYKFRSKGEKIRRDSIKT